MKIVIDCRFWGPEHTGLGRYTKNLVLNLLNIDKKNDYYLLLNKPSSTIAELKTKKAPFLVKGTHLWFNLLYVFTLHYNNSRIILVKYGNLS